MLQLHISMVGSQSLRLRYLSQPHWNHSRRVMYLCFLGMDGIIDVKGYNIDVTIPWLRNACPKCH